LTFKQRIYLKEITMKKILILAIYVALGTTATPLMALEAPLQLAEAETLALENDPMLQSFAERRRAMQETAIAEAQLPDPTLRFGGANLPATSLSLTPEQMTQLQVGVGQSFPRGDTLRIRGERASARAEIERQKQEARLATLLLDVRTAWLETYYWQNAIGILNSQETALEQLVEVTQAHYAQGRGQQQDVLRANLELSLLADKIIDAERQLENAQAVLARWIGADDAARPLTSTIPALGTPLSFDQIKNAIVDHPLLGIRDAEIQVQRREVDLARQAYKPMWGVNVSYGSRASDSLGRDRADFVSVMVNLDIPLFTGNRQDRRLSAARRQESATRLIRDDQIRLLNQMLDDSWSDWQRSGERLTLYSDEILGVATETYDVTLNAYRNEVADFALLIRARLLDFETRLQALGLSTEHEKALARLLYLQGEE
jgi:outer membrane protein TolC